MLHRVRYVIDVARGMLGTHPRTCPACGFVGRFRAHGLPPRFDARCPRCNGLERHRLFVLVDQRHRLVGAGSALLHIAPEPVLSAHLTQRVATYTTLDLYRPADIRAPLEQTGIADQSFDHIVCSHVLEHVDDRRALAEMFRILRPGGTLLAMMPVIEGWTTTYEASISSASVRAQHFGQHDHVRYYGSDVRERIRAAGFALDEKTAEGADVVRYGLLRGEKVFVGTRPP